MLEKIVAEMPKVDNPFPQEEFVDRAGYVSLRKICGNLIEAQCRLLAEQGYRPVPSENKVIEKIASSKVAYELSPREVLERSRELHRLWLEGE